MFAVCLHPTDECSLSFVVNSSVGEDELADTFCASLGVFGRDLDGGRLEWEDRGFADVEKGNVVLFISRLKEDDTETFAPGSPGATAAMEENLRVARWINLDNEVDLGNIQPSCGDIRREEYGWASRVNKAVEVLVADLRWLFAVERDKLEFGDGR